ncbi:MAG: S-methyl-5'-thioadenosine phosphorylase [Deltaproteobacteria bacterium]|nr:S-methyl-5'-thioadenosine phosphorylase [Deltaproteobacteria bacterium]
MSHTIGIIGGSGLYEIEGLKNIQEKKIKTPFGIPSDVFTIGQLKETTLVFLPRHGKGHLLSPSEINYRANVFGMKKLGVQTLLSLSAVGSMKEEIKPGDVVVVDQFIDRTKGIREHTFFEKGLVAHVSFADPICKALADIVCQATQKVTSRLGQRPLHKKGTYLCMEGPQFSTRAESRLYRSWGVDVIGMTAVPEVKLAREAEICYSTIAFSTDYDCWKEDEEAVSADKVLATIKKNVDTAKKIIQEVIPLIVSKTSCGCAQTLKYALVTDRTKIPSKTKKDLTLLLGKYL